MRGKAALDRPFPTLAVEVEEEIDCLGELNNACVQWSYTPCIVRKDEEVVVSIPELVPGVELPVNNTTWALARRDAAGWTLAQREMKKRARDPSPLGLLNRDRLAMSFNAVDTPEDDRTVGEPTTPQILEFSLDDLSKPPKVRFPKWMRPRTFTDHSRRSLACDSENGELILYQQAGLPGCAFDNTHPLPWVFLDRNGDWSHQGELPLPRLSAWGQPEVAVGYGAVVLKDRAAHYCGQALITEPNPEWRAFKEKHGGNMYHRRSLFYTWTPDITQEPFSGWLEAASCEETAGQTAPMDLCMDDDGDVHLLHLELALEESMRETFFPDAEQSVSLVQTVIRDGEVIRKTTVAAGSEEQGSGVPGWAYFHRTPDARLFVYYGWYRTMYWWDKAGGDPWHGEFSDEPNIIEHRLVELYPDGTMSDPRPIPFEKPLQSFYLPAANTGTAPSGVMDVMGVFDHSTHKVHYGRVRLGP